MKKIAISVLVAALASAPVLAEPNSHSEGTGISRDGYAENMRGASAEERKDKRAERKEDKRERREKAKQHHERFKEKVQAKREAMRGEFKSWLEDERRKHKNANPGRD